jgi:mannose-1-phosphate guanylyltransferase
MHSSNFTAYLLAAGMGTRLRPLTFHWPKSLMPINGKPLLSIWLRVLIESGCKKAFVNTSHHAEKVEKFLKKSLYVDWVESLYEPNLLGTAGTLIKNYEKIKDQTILLIHADNLCDCDFSKFIDYHYAGDRKKYPITMMTFCTDTPLSCGIVDLNEDDVVINMHEKKNGVNGRIANAAIYFIEPEVIDWIHQKKNISDFILEVLPFFYGRIRTWHNNELLRDIGTVSALRSVQRDDIKLPLYCKDEEWCSNFLKNSILSNIFEE